MGGGTLLDDAKVGSRDEKEKEVHHKEGLSY
jgi:hypothetical protein